MDAIQFSEFCGCTLGLTTTQVAAELGLSKRQVHRYESGAAPVPRAVALALEALYLRPAGEWMAATDRLGAVASMHGASPAAIDAARTLRQAIRDAVCWRQPLRCDRHQALANALTDAVAATGGGAVYMLWHIGVACAQLGIAIPPAAQEAVDRVEQYGREQDEVNARAMAATPCA